MYPIAIDANGPTGRARGRGGHGRLRMTPGRRAALIIGVPVCLAFIAAGGFQIVGDLGQASYPVHHTFPASARRVAVSIDAGQLTLTQAGIDKATLTGTAHYSLFRTTPAVTKNSYNYPCHNVVGNCSLDATLTVPVGKPASVSSNGGNLLVSGTTGNVSLSTGGGNLTADNLSGALTLNTSGGDIQATAIRAPDVTATSGGGNIEIVFTAVPRDVHVDTSGGDITVVVPKTSSGYRVSWSTAGGSATVEPGMQNSFSPDKITATSGGGNILIEEAAR